MTNINKKYMTLCTKMQLDTEEYYCYEDKGYLQKLTLWSLKSTLNIVACRGDL
jgi:hypothetical protein